MAPDLTDPRYPRYATIVFALDSTSARVPDQPGIVYLVVPRIYDRLVSEGASAPSGPYLVTLARAVLKHEGGTFVLDRKGRVSFLPTDVQARWLDEHADSDGDGEPDDSACDMPAHFLDDPEDNDAVLPWCVEPAPVCCESGSQESATSGPQLVPVGQRVCE